MTEDESYQLIASGVVDESIFTGASGFSLEAYPGYLTVILLIFA